MTDGPIITVRLTPDMAGSLIAAANLVAGANGDTLRGVGWDGTQIRTLVAARRRFENAALIAFELTDVKPKGETA